MGVYLSDEIKVKKLPHTECRHNVLERDMFANEEIWRCIYCDSVVKLKKRSHDLQKKVQKQEAFLRIAEKGR